MKLVVFNEGRPGLLTERGVVDVSGLMRPLGGQDGYAMRLIERYEELKPELERLAAKGTALPLASVKLKAPVPRAKVLAMGGNYREFGAPQALADVGLPQVHGRHLRRRRHCRPAGGRRQHLPPRGRAGRRLRQRRP